MSLLSNKVAIITGASSGIGRASAILFAREGASVVLAPRGVCNFSFLDDQAPQTPLSALAQRWPEAELREAPSRTQGVIHTMFDGSKTPDRPLSLHVSGTNFQISVWRALLQIPPAKVVSYAQVASAVGNPKAARAVGLAVGANPIALMIPCHPQRSPHF